MMPSWLQKFLTRRLVFRFGNRQKSKWAKSGEYGRWGRTLKLHLVAEAIAIWIVWAGAWSCKSRLESHYFFFSSQSPDAAALILVHYLHHLSSDLPHLSSDLPQDNPHCFSLSQKIVAITFPADETLLNFFRWGEPRCLHCILSFFASGSVMDPSLTLGHNLTHKYPMAIFIERQESLGNIMPALLLIFGQHSGIPSSQDLGYP